MINTFSRKEEVKFFEKVVYSELVCRNCGHKERFRGKVTYECIPDNWYALSLHSQASCYSALDWLLCEDCTKKVMDAAGL